ncbi:MAG: hypothetical protein BWK73_38830 [Thiothrix lacustris]|uniref:Uncharacterized protein n=1 Tax=Thiothrix lacustris TaxID=525917 RepID=A0A1Y1QE86_9GAMM|nr:MAG: hypothetical protein BWK73_38830 [Thiothrix lacustris]
MAAYAALYGRSNDTHTNTKQVPMTTFTALTKVNEYLGFSLEPSAFEIIGFDSPAPHPETGALGWHGEGVLTTIMVLLLDHLHEIDPVVFSGAVGGEL